MHLEPPQIILSHFEIQNEANEKDLIEEAKDSDSEILSFGDDSTELDE